MNRLGNLLNALAGAVTDAQAAAMAEHAGMKPSAAATVLTLGQNDMLTVSDMSKIVGITHSAMVRLIDGLERRGLVSRGRGRDGREVAVCLTEDGVALYAALRRAQADVLDSLVRRLSADQQDAFEDCLAVLLAALTKGRRSADHICRFCDEEVCQQDRCPVESQAQRLADG